MAIFVLWRWGQAIPASLMWKQVLAVPVVVVSVVPVLVCVVPVVVVSVVPLGVVCAATVDRQRLLALVAAGSGWDSAWSVVGPDHGHGHSQGHGQGQSQSHALGDGCSTLPNFSLYTLKCRNYWPKVSNGIKKPWITPKPRSRFYVKRCGENTIVNAAKRSADLV